MRGEAVRVSEKTFVVGPENWKPAPELVIEWKPCLDCGKTRWLVNRERGAGWNLRCVGCGWTTDRGPRHDDLMGKGSED